MDLSVCMMVKNEEKNLERCLKSLNELTIKLNCEIIVVDTGSTDNTVEIAKKYTNKLFFHQWENDFSKMRNISISYATGQWIFIIDADEEVLNCDKIIEFIKSPLNSKYHSGFCTLTNVGDENIKYSAIFTPRLFRKGEIRYDGAVHNQPIFNTPVADLSTKMLHYGYIRTDKDLMKKKFERTSKMLLDQLEKDPENIYYRFQLSVSYSMYEEDQKAYEEILKVYEKIKDSNDNNPIYVYQQMAMCAVNVGNFEKVREASLRGIALEPNFIDLHFYHAQSESILKNYDDAIAASKKYLKLFDMFNNNDLTVNSSQTLYTLGNKDTIIYNLGVIYKELNKIDDALYYVTKINSGKDFKSAIKFVVLNCLEYKKYRELINYYMRLLKDSSKEFIVFFRAILENKKLSLLDEDKFSIEEIFCGDDAYGLLNRIRVGYKSNNNISSLIVEFLENNNLNNLSNYYGDIIYISFKYNVNTTKYIKNVIDSNKVIYFSYINSYYNDFGHIIKKLLLEFKVTDFDELKLKMFLQAFYLENYEDELSNFEDMFNAYISDGYQLVENVYGKQNILNEAVSQVGTNEEAYFIYRYLAYHKYIDDEQNFNKYNKMAIDIYGEINNILNKLEALKKHHKLLELENYKSKLKDKINTLVTNGNLNEAVTLINEYKQMIPGDIEIYSMYGVVEITKGNLLEAEKVLQEGLEKDANNFDLNYNLAYVYEQKGLYLDALETYEKIVFNMEDNEQRQKIIVYLNRMEDRYKDKIQNQLEQRQKYIDKTINNEKKVYLHFIFDSPYCDKIIEIINDKFSSYEHKFLIIGKRNLELKYIKMENRRNVEILDLECDTNKLRYYIDNCSNIFIQYLFDIYCEIICNFAITKPIYWFLWCGDLYNYIDFDMYGSMTKKILDNISIINKNSINYIYRKAAIRKIDKVGISFKEDFKILKKNFITTVECNDYVFPNPMEYKKLNVFSQENKYEYLKRKFKNVILVGNSANPSNNHIDILSQLKKIRNQSFCIIMPLSYGGNQEYIYQIVKLGKDLFNDRFIPLLEYINPIEYGKLLSIVDSAIMAHNRPQAAGNINALIYLGKKVFMKSNSSFFLHLKEIGVEVFDISEIKNIDNLFTMDIKIQEANKIRIFERFSDEAAIKAMSRFFD